MNKYILYTVLLSLFFFSCVDENLNNIAENQFVVEAFIYAGEPINDIRIKSSFPLADEEDNSVPINDAQVTLMKGSQSYSLISSGQDGFYHYPGNDAEVTTGDVFHLEIQHNGIIATAQTIVPTPTTGLQLSKDTVLVPELPLREGREAVQMVIGEFIRNSSIDAIWDNPNDDLYFMIVESLSEQTDPIFPDVVTNALERFRFVSEPTNDSMLTFLSGTLVSFGTYQVRVYHINQEYAALYENREQDSRDLNEPPSNVTNALGVFSAFNSQNAFFELARE